MSLLNRIANFFRQDYSSLIGYIGGTEVYANIDSTNVIERGFETNTAVYSIVMTDAEKFASIPRYLYDSEGNEIEGENKLTKLLDQPNSYENGDLFWQKVRATYKICGEAIIWMNRGLNDPAITDDQWAKQPPLELHCLLPTAMVLIKSPNDPWGIVGWKLSDGGFTRRFRAIDIIHWKTPALVFDPVGGSHLRGWPPLASGYKTLQQNNDATGASVRMYQNDGSKGFVFNKSLTKLNPKQESDLRGIINSKLNNLDDKGSVAFLPGEWGYADLMSGVDLKLLEGKKLTWQELCYLLGVPYENFDPQTTFANKEQAQKGWVSNKIIPACKQLDGELNKKLLPAFGIEGYEIKSDFSGLPEMQIDIAKTVEALSKAPVSVNEFREAIGYDRVNDAQFDEIMVPSGATPASQMGSDGFEEMRQEIQQQLQNGKYNN